MSKLREAMREFENALIERALLVAEGNITHAAFLLGVPRTFLQRKLKQRTVAPVVDCWDEPTVIIPELAANVAIARAR